MKTTPSWFLGCALLACAWSSARSASAVTLTWSVVTDQPNASSSRSFRGLALSENEQTLYAGLVQGGSTAGFRSYDLTLSPPLSPTHFHDVNAVDSTTLRQAEAVTTDDRGIVYGASIKDSTSTTPNARIMLLSADFATVKHFSLADLTSPPSNITGETVGGLSLRKAGGVYQLYVTRYLGTSAYIERYVVGGTDVASATLTLDPTFDGDGTFNLQTLVAAAKNLRGIEVAADGTMFVASREGNAVYKIAPNLSTVTTTTLSNAMDLALYGGNVYVTQYAGASSAIVELKQSDLSLTGNSFTATGSFPHPNAATGYSGIDIDAAGRIYLNDQIYATGGALDSDRILVSSPLPEPSSFVLVGIGGVVVFGSIRRSRRRAEQQAAA